MALPPSFLQHVEQPGCFTGCYGSDSDVSVCLDPTRPLEPMVVVSCLDCLKRIGVPLALLPGGTTTYGLARQLTDHMRVKRGFALAKSGYHTAGPGFWLSVAYYGCGLFLVDASRSRNAGSDLDVLLLAFQHGVITPPDPRMRDPKQYRVETVHLNYSQFQTGITGKAALLASPQCRAQAQNGWHKVTLAEFLPLSQAAAPAPATTAASATATRILRIGDICPKCKAEVRVRPLLRGSYVGCLC